jgi:hypothetical protein
MLIYGTGYGLEFLITVLAMSFDLPGPYSDSPVVWAWFALGVLAVFSISFGFCRWFARRIEKNLLLGATFE